MGNFVIRQIDINTLFLVGFTFFIGAFSFEMMAKYLTFLIFGVLFLSINNWFRGRKKK